MALNVLNCISTVLFRLIHRPLYQLRLGQVMKNRLLSTNTCLPMFLFPNCNTCNFDKKVIIDEFDSFNFRNLLRNSILVANKLPECYQEHVGIICPNNAHFLVALYACWLKGAIAVPLNYGSIPTFEYCIQHSKCNSVLTMPEEVLPLESILKNHNLLRVEIDILKTVGDGPYSKEFFKSEISVKNKTALLLYTSGTTTYPKAVLLTFNNLFAQMEAVSENINFQTNDIVLNSAPFFHSYGLINGLLAPLKAGATCIMLHNNNETEVYNRLLGYNPTWIQPNIFTGFPIMYKKIIERIKNKYGKTRKHALSLNFIHSHLKQEFRLMLCGSAPLALPIFEEWLSISGHKLLDEYCATEFGTVLKNNKILSYTGVALKDIQIRIVKRNAYSSFGYDILAEYNHHEIKLNKNVGCPKGELQIKGQNVFIGYYDQTLLPSSFTDDHWFKTGDIIQSIKGSIHILGRALFDVIKSGGHQINALEVESYILAHHNVKDCAVIGLPDRTWGSRVVTLVVPINNELEGSTILDWCCKGLPLYSVPSQIIQVEEIPRNITGDIMKSKLIIETIKRLK